MIISLLDITQQDKKSGKKNTTTTEATTGIKQQISQSIVEATFTSPDLAQDSTTIMIIQPLNIIRKNHRLNQEHQTPTTM